MLGLFQSALLWRSDSANTKANYFINMTARYIFYCMFFLSRNVERHRWFEHIYLRLVLIFTFWDYRQSLEMCYLRLAIYYNRHTNRIFKHIESNWLIILQELVGDTKTILSEVKFPLIALYILKAKNTNVFNLALRYLDKTKSLYLAFQFSFSSVPVRIVDRKHLVVHLEAVFLTQLHQECHSLLAMTAKS